MHEQHTDRWRDKTTIRHWLDQIDAVLAQRSRRGRRPLERDAQAAVRREVVTRVREVWAENPNLSLEKVLVMIGRGRIHPNTARDWLKRLPPE